MYTTHLFDGIMEFDEGKRCCSSSLPTVRHDVVLDRDCIGLGHLINPIEKELSIRPSATTLEEE